MLGCWGEFQVGKAWRNISYSFQSNFLFLRQGKCRGGFSVPIGSRAATSLEIRVGRPGFSPRRAHDVWQTLHFFLVREEFQCGTP